jgi:hypothetical protein
VRIIRRGSGSVATGRRAQIVLLPAQGMDAPAIAKVAFTREDPERANSWPSLADRRMPLLNVTILGQSALPSISTMAMTPERGIGDLKLFEPITIASLVALRGRVERLPKFEWPDLDCG